jgi:hypothetical protein
LLECATFAVPNCRGSAALTTLRDGKVHGREQGHQPMRA